MVGILWIWVWFLVKEAWGFEFLFEITGFLDVDARLESPKMGGFA